MLLIQEKELCVCQLTEALAMVQPKISRHLAILREKKILLDKRKGLWIFYRLHPEIPTWAYNVLIELSTGCFDRQPYTDDLLKARSVNLSNTKNTCS